MGSGGMKRKGRRHLPKVSMRRGEPSADDNVSAAKNWFLRAPESPPPPGVDAGNPVGDLYVARYVRWAGFAAIAAGALHLRRRRNLN